MEGVKNPSKSSSKTSKSSIYNTKKLISKDYRPRFTIKYKCQLFISKGKNQNFYIRSLLSKKSKILLDLKKVLIDGDVLLLRPLKETEYLIADVIYSVKIAINTEQLLKIIGSKSQEKRENIIVITNGPDMGDLNRIQANEETSVKAIIWFNAGYRGLDFTDAENFLKLPQEKKKNREAIEKINELTRELQEIKEKYE